MSSTGIKYFISFVDNFFHVTCLYLMKSRSELFFLILVPFCDKNHTQFHVFIQTLGSDNAKKYLSKLFHSFMLEHGILHQTSYIDTPSQNGVAKRNNRHLLETA